MGTIKVDRKCRYCSNCMDGFGEDMYYCHLQDRPITKTSANRKNKCEDFDFTKYDAFTGKKIGEIKW